MTNVSNWSFRQLMTFMKLDLDQEKTFWHECRKLLQTVSDEYKRKPPPVDSAAPYWKAPFQAVFEVVTPDADEDNRYFLFDLVYKFGRTPPASELLIEGMEELSGPDSYLDKLNEFRQQSNQHKPFLLLPDVG